MATPIELADIQGIIIRGYGYLDDARFGVLEITDAAKARAWLGSLELTNGEEDRHDKATNIAFTHAGLRRLGLDKDALDEFSLQFTEGMTGTNSGLALGDIASLDDPPSRPTWNWGGNPETPVHAILLVYGKRPGGAAAEYKALRDTTGGGFSAAGFKEVVVLDTNTLTYKHNGKHRLREHFGFSDGVAQPHIEAGLQTEGDHGILGPTFADNRIATGELILGYPDESGGLPASPSIRSDRDPRNLLARHGMRPKRKDFGRNGSYLVARQLEQDVGGFWRSVRAHALARKMAPVALAAKMVGRWPSGASLTLHPNNPTGGDDDDFGYWSHGDAAGKACPLGAHVRRANPRDFDGASRQDPAIARKHRILRRARPYGKEFPGFPDPMRMAKPTTSATGTRGLHFLCINSNIATQFEFLQGRYINNPSFATLGEVDPLIGSHPKAHKTFSIQGLSKPLPKTPTGLAMLDVWKPVESLERFVSVKGGAYFFLPSLTAVKYLASLPG